MALIGRRYCGVPKQQINSSTSSRATVAASLSPHGVRFSPFSEIITNHKNVFVATVCFWERAKISIPTLWICNGALGRLGGAILEVPSGQLRLQFLTSPPLPVPTLQRYFQNRACTTALAVLVLSVSKPLTISLRTVTLNVASLPTPPTDRSWSFPATLKPPAVSPGQAGETAVASHRTSNGSSAGEHWSCLQVPPHPAPVARPQLSIYASRAAAFGHLQWSLTFGL